MKHYKALLINTLILSIVLMVTSTAPTSAQGQYSPPEMITVQMYQLEQDTGESTGTPCTKDEPAIARSYGCTAITDDPNYAYPFDTSEITIGREGHLQNGIQQGYLQN